MRTLNLMIFRAQSRDASEDVVELDRLKTEVFPGWPTASYDLGKALADADRRAEANAAFERALSLLDGKDEISDVERERARNQILEALASIGDQP